MTTPHADTAEQRDALLASLDAFTRAYIDCALWSSTDSSEEESAGEFIDQNYGPEDLSLETLRGAVDDCAAFQKECSADLDCAYGNDSEDDVSRRSRSVYDASNAGHDLWLTRNGHGAGFWDRGLGAIGERLSKAAKAYGSVDLVVSEGVIYGE